MKLRRVEINGFKSFGRKTVLEFPEGISAIVGPNGSGKSNVIDAICFGLGYPSRNLRAAKAQELIHSGKKGNSTEAKVMLTFHKGQETFEVKRKVDRSGRSVYKLNAITTSLDDLHDTLSKHAIPKDGYNIVMQNDVMKFTEIKPVERRRLLDEISGISGYEEKKKRSLEELAVVERRISDTNLILSEKKGYLDEIGKDREAAVKYQGIHDEYKKGKSIYLYSSLYSLENEAGEVEVKSERVGKEKEVKIIELARLDEEIDKIEGNVEKVTKQMIASTVGESGKIRGDIGALKSAIEKKQEEIQFLKGEIQDYDTRKKENAERQKKIKGEIREKEEELKKLRGEIEKANKSLAGKEKEREDRAKDYDNAELITLDKERKELSESVFESKRAITLLGKELDIIGKRGLEISELTTVKKASLKSLEEDLTELEKNVARLGAEAEKTEKMSKELEEVKVKMQDLYQEFARKESEIKTIERIEAQRGESESLKFVISNKDKGYVGQVSELGSAPDKYKIALEVAAGDRSRCLVVKDDTSAQFYIEGLRKNKIGRATFLPMNKIQGPSLVEKKWDQTLGIIGYARDLIKCDAKYQKVFDFVFAETVVVKDIDSARKIGIGAIRMVTLDGDLLFAGGGMTGGYYQKAAVTFSSTAEAKKRLDDIKGEITNLKEKKDKLEKVLEGKEKINLGVLKEKKSNIAEKIGVLRRELDELGKEQGKFGPQEREMSSKKSELEKLVAKEEQELASIDERMNAKAFNEMKSIMQTIDDQLHELKDARFGIQSKENSLRGEIEGMSSKIKDIDNQTGELDASISKFKKKIQESIDQITENGRKLGDLEQKHQVATAESQKIIQEQERLSQLMRELGEKRGGLEAVLERLKNEANDLEVKKAKVEAKLEEVRNNIQGVEPPKKEDMQGVNINQLKRRVKELEDELAMIGSVNLRAVGMYDELQQQYAEIKEKNEKLYLEKEKIYDLIETIEEKKKAVFYDSFYKVKEHFSQIISELYPSTEGDLTIENEADPFNSGLLVQVKPRGREGMNIDALSGGEKTLTAIAFLMATQEVTPSAFYILDEVDAALDQENVLRLVQFLKNRKQSQFILISHNPETVKHMDSVIGVHMQDGISQVVGVNMRAEAA